MSEQPTTLEQPMTLHPKCGRAPLLFWTPNGWSEPYSHIRQDIADDCDTYEPREVTHDEVLSYLAGDEDLDADYNLAPPRIHRHGLAPIVLPFTGNTSLHIRGVPSW